MSVPACPTCASPLAEAGGQLACEQQHAFTPDGLTLASNLAAVKALWMAIRALEDDAAGLEWRLGQRTPADHLHAEYERQAAATREAARHLREMAGAAQARLDALPVAPSGLRLAPAQEDAGGA